MADRRKESSKDILNPILAWLFVISLSILLGASFLNYFGVAKIYSTSRLEAGMLLSQGVGLTLADKLRAKDYAELELVLQKSFFNRDVELAIISDPSGKKILSIKRNSNQDQIETFYDSNPLPLPDSEHGIKTKIEVDSNLKIWHPLDSSQSVGWLYLELNDDRESLVMNRLKSNIVIVTGVIFTIIFIALFIFNRNIKRVLLKHDGEIIEEKNYWNNKALQDSLTKLPNRRNLFNIIQLAISHADEQQQLLGIIFLDLDGFKTINDQHGHQAGDLLLVKFSQRLIKLFRSEDQVTRYGGDEFVIVCENLANEIELETLIKRVFETINTPYNLNGILVNVSVSMGVTIYPKDTALTPSELVAHADEAMYSAKQLGKNRHHYY